MTPNPDALADIETAEPADAPTMPAALEGVREVKLHTLGRDDAGRPGARSRA